MYIIMMLDAGNQRWIWHRFWYSLVQSQGGKTVRNKYKKRMLSDVTDYTHRMSLFWRINAMRYIKWHFTKYLTLLLHTVRAIQEKPGFSPAIFLYLLSSLYLFLSSPWNRDVYRQKTRWLNSLLLILVPSPHYTAWCSAVKIKESLRVSANQITTLEWLPVSLFCLVPSTLVWAMPNSHGAGGVWDQGGFWTWCFSTGDFSRLVRSVFQSSIPLGLWRVKLPRKWF